MSPRAAWRLETLGFTKVYDYVGGKADWFAAGLPREGKLSGVLRAGDVARRDDVTCQLGDPIGDVSTKVSAAGKDECIVVTDGNVVLGRIRNNALGGDAQAIAEDVMEPGPTTLRTDSTLDSTIESLKSRSVTRILVTTSDGRLYGTLYLSDAEARLAAEPIPSTQTQVDDDEVCCCCDD